MLTEALLSAVVEATFGYVLDQTGLAEKIRASLGRGPQQLAFKIALSRAYTAFARNYPQWTASLFDEHFLTHRAAPFLACCLARDAAPDPAGLATVWADQLGLEGERRQRRIAELTPASAAFLDSTSYGFGHSVRIKDDRSVHIPCGPSAGLYQGSF